jgi:metal-responsive CopG/Arc/MetJ family transcriptional regulator
MTKKMNISFEEDPLVVDTLDEVARAKGTSRSDLLRDTVRDLLARYKPEFIIPPFPKARIGRPRKDAQ